MYNISPRTAMIIPHKLYTIVILPHKLIISSMYRCYIPMYSYSMCMYTYGKKFSAHVYMRWHYPIPPNAEDNTASNAGARL